MSGAPLLATSSQTPLVVILIVLATLVVAGIVVGLYMVTRRGSPPASTDEEEAMTSDESSEPAPPAPWTGPDAFAPRPPVTPLAASPGATPTTEEAAAEPAATEPSRPAAVPESVAAAGDVSQTQTPDDVDERSPAELAAAARLAESEPEEDANTGRADETAIEPPPTRSLATSTPPDPARLRLLGLALGMLTERMRRENPQQLGTALARLVDSDTEGARGQLTTLALSLLGEDQQANGGDHQLSLFLEEALQGEVSRGFSFSSMPEFQQALSAVAPELREKLQTIVWARNADSVAILTTEDVETLERVAVAMATALMLDTSYDLRTRST